MRKLFSKAITATAVLTTMVMLLSLSACAPKKKPEEIYAEAMAKYNSLSSQEMKALINMELAMVGENTTPDMTMNIAMDTNIKLVKQGESYEIQMDASTSLMGMAMDINYYFKDNYMYMDMMGQKVKQLVPIDEMQAQISGSQAQDIPMDMMDKFEMTTDKDGTNLFAFTVKKDAMDQYVKDSLGAMGDAGLPDGDMNMEMGEMSGTLTVNKAGDVVAQTMNMTFSMDVEGIKANVTMIMDATVVNPGQPVTITAPDLTGYIDMSEMTDIPVSPDGIAPAPIPTPPAAA